MCVCGNVGYLSIYTFLPNSAYLLSSFQLYIIFKYNPKKESYHNLKVTSSIMYSSLCMNVQMFVQMGLYACNCKACRKGLCMKMSSSFYLFPLTSLCATFILLWLSVLKGVYEVCRKGIDEKGKDVKAVELNMNKSFYLRWSGSQLHTEKVSWSSSCSSCSSVKGMLMALALW